MRRLLFAFLSFTLLIPTSVEAHKTVLYKNQKAGQFCKTVDIGRYVILPDETRLICEKDGTKARWGQ
jgi:hypothetical protein